MLLIRKKLLALVAVMGMLVAGSLFAADSNLPNLGSSTGGYSAQNALKRDAVCTRCHDESETAPVLTIYQTKHGVRGDSRTPTCQSCHGESEDHLKGNTSGKGRPAPDHVFKKGVYAANDDKDRAGQCLNCHKGTARTNWDGGAHQNNQVACNDCHKVHAPADNVLAKKTQTQVCFTCHKDQRADSHKVSTHPIDAGKVVCSDCHNPHGSVGPTLLKKNTINETCFTCHADKRGPFLWEHQPVVDSCVNCHVPHGSNIPPLMKTRTPYLCQSCHDGSHASGSAAGRSVAGNQAGFVGSPSINTNGRGCNNCHSVIHGSNSPNGGYFQR